MKKRATEIKKIESNALCSKIAYTGIVTKVIPAERGNSELVFADGTSLIAKKAEQFVWKEGVLSRIIAFVYPGLGEKVPHFEIMDVVFENRNI